MHENNTAENGLLMQSSSNRVSDDMSLGAEGCLAINLIYLIWIIYQLVNSSSLSLYVYTIIVNYVM